MNLYYVSLYNRERNERARCMVRAASVALAEELACQWLGGHWRTVKVIRVDDMIDDVMEL